MNETETSIGKIISLQKIVDPRGNLSLAEAMKDIPFNISRVYWTYDVPSGACRGGHAHKHCREFIIAVSGSFTVTLDDFSSGAVCLVLAEDPFEENDYIREYTEFLNYKCSKKG